MRSRSLRSRLLVAFLAVLVAYGVLFFSFNWVFILRYRDEQTVLRLAELEALREMEACDHDPSWWMPDRGLGGVVPLDVDGRPRPAARTALGDAFAGPFEVAPQPGVVVGQTVEPVSWAATVRVDRPGECRTFLVYQERWMNLKLGTFVLLTASRWGAGLVLVGLAWWWVVSPLVRAIRRLAEQVSRVAQEGFATEIEVPPEQELALVASAFNAATAVARERLALLEERDRLTREVMANVAHDVRTPLCALKLAIGRVARQSPEALPYSALRELETLDALIGNLSTLVQLEGTSLPLLPRELDARDIVERVTARFRIASEGKRVSLQSGVPELPVGLRADPVALEQALSNLVQNAVDFAEGNVAVSCRREGATVAFEVRDDGPGVDPAELPRLFERHFRGDANVPRGRAGQGLGLHIASEVARRHGGSVTLARGEPTGTVARLVLPTPAPSDPPDPVRG